MNFFYSVWLLVSGTIALWVGWVAWRRRPAVGARELTMLMLALAVWAFAYAFYWRVETLKATEFWMSVMFCGVIVTPVAFFLLVLHYIGQHDWLTRKAYEVILPIPVLSIIFLWTDPIHHLFFGDARINTMGLITKGGPWFYVFLYYSYTLMGIGFFLLLRYHQRSSPYYQRQVRIILLGIILPWFVNGFIMLGWVPLEGLDITPMLFTVTGLLMAYALFGYHMMDLVPVGRDALVEHLDDAIVMVDDQDRIVDINPKALEFAEPGKDQAVGRQLQEVFPHWADIISNGALLEKRKEVRLENSEFSFLDIMAVTVKDRQGRLLGKLASWRDISERKSIEDQLRIFYMAVEQNPSAILITDPQGHIEYINPRLVELTGYCLDELIGKTPKIFQSGETADQLYAGMWKTIKAGQAWKGELLNRNKMGQSYWVSELIAPVLDSNGSVTHFVAMQEDITERKHAEAELRKTNTLLQVQLEANQALQEKLREEAIHDGLTRLFNRRYMEETLAREISRAQREPQPISVVMMDVDRFKSINDRYGHQAGDLVLQNLGKMLMENTRMSDIACRYGGDEMLVVMPGATEEAAIARAEEWRLNFSLMEFSAGDGTIRTTLSLGVACFPEQAQNPSDLLNASDKALYWAKINRNQVQMYNPATMGRYQYRSSDFC